ncbi:cytochrome c biogenesis protein transmembrane region [Fusobacterium sp. CAG:439]|nr:cytochrome c biogenesis protein transmembrane region [Fusobacterium sp. CAG:439]HIT91584.1 sulfite exporter TauE/SafE family protein [Candidatus Stercorousia faecigallinarum]
MENYISLFTQNGSLPLLFALSFLGGLVASISPCSLAMLPIIIGYIGGYSDAKPLKTFIQMLFFVFGTAIVFSVIGIICAITGKVFISFAGGYFGIFLAGIIMVMGLKLIGVLDFELPVMIKEMPKNDGTNTYLYPIILGGIFALAGTPCSTPILAGIMAFASLSASITQAILMLFLFSLGQGLILILAGFLTSHLKNWKGFYKFSDWLLKISGGLLVIASIYIFYKIFSPFFV